MDQTSQEQRTATGVHAIPSAATLAVRANARDVSRADGWNARVGTSCGGASRSAEADGNRTRLAEMLGHVGFEDREGHQAPRRLQAPRLFLGLFDIADGVPEALEVAR